MSNLDKHKQLLEGKRDPKLEKAMRDFYGAGIEMRKRLVEISGGYDGGNYKERDISKLKRLMEDAIDLAEKIQKKHLK